MISHGYQEQWWDGDFDDVFIVIKPSAYIENRSGIDEGLLGLSLIEFRWVTHEIAEDVDGNYNHILHLVEHEDAATASIF